MSKPRDVRFIQSSGLESYLRDEDTRYRIKIPKKRKKPKVYSRKFSTDGGIENE